MQSKQSLGLILFVGVLAVLVFSISGVAVYAQTVTANTPIVNLEVPIGETVQVSGLAQYVQIFYRFTVVAVAIIAATMIMYAGISWLTAAGGTQKIGEAKERIIAAISGLVLAMLSYAILNTINPGLTSLMTPEIILSETPAYIAPAINRASGEGIGAVIVLEAQARAESDDLQHDCCWGWVRAVYNEAGAKAGSTVYKKASLSDCAACHGTCTSAELTYYRSAANTSLCTDGDVPYTEIQPGDWLYYFNGNRYDTGEHSVIFLYWTDESNHEAMCASAPGAGTSGNVHSCDFDIWPITRITHPTASQSYSSTAGACG